MASTFDLPRFDEIKPMLLEYLNNCNPQMDRDCEEFPQVIADESDIPIEDLIEMGYFKEITTDPDEAFLVEEIISPDDQIKAEKDFCEQNPKECLDEYESNNIDNLDTCINTITEEFIDRNLNIEKPIYRGISIYQNISPNEIKSDPKKIIYDTIVKEGRGIGKYWSYSEENAEQYWCEGTKCPTYDIILQGHVLSPDTYDIKGTYLTNYVFQCKETEIRLKKGDQIKITNVCIKKNYWDDKNIVCIPWNEIYTI